MIAWTAAGALGILLALGAWERVQRDRAHAAIPIRIHVNGTRGKSTVTRQIAAALRASGCPTMAKTTGTAARVIGVDGTETPIRRRGGASIREQLWLLRQARHLGARAVVIECMAIDPALQRVSEHHMIRSTIGVITNARPDHADLMGATVEEVTQALAGTVPRGGTLVLGPDLPRARFEDIASRHATAVVVADPEVPRAIAGQPLPSWRLDNLAVALAVTRALSIPDDVAWPAMLAAPDDPGALTVRHAIVRGRALPVIDGSAANDPESLALVLRGLPSQGARLFVFNHRADRPLRLRQFADATIWREPGTCLLITGDAPDRATRAAVELAIDAARVGVAPIPGLAARLRETIARETAIGSVVLCGNTKHLEPAALVAAITES